MRVAVDAGAPPDPRTQLVDYSGLYKYAADFLAGEMFNEIELPELLVERVPEDGRTDSGRILKAYADYELRYVETRVSHSGVIGKCTPRDLAMTIRANYNVGVERMHLEQPQAQWRLVAAKVRRDQVNRQFDRTGNVGRAPVYNLPSLIASANAAEERAMKVGRGEAAQGLSDQKIISDTSVRADFRCMLCCVFTDVSQSALEDPWEKRFPGERGTGSAYADSGELRHLPPHLKRERLLAKMLIQDLIEEGKRVTEAEFEEEISEDAARTMLMCRQQGMKWGEIAKAFGVSKWQMVKKAVLAIDESVKADDDEDA